MSISNFIKNKLIYLNLFCLNVNCLIVLEFKRNESSDYGFDVLKEPTFNMEPYNTGNAWNSSRMVDNNLFSSNINFYITYLQLL